MVSIPAHSNTVQDTIPQTGIETNISFPIATDYSSIDQQQQIIRPNKYVYQIFDGFSGERYLKKLLEQILPYALFRTWSHAVDFQKPGNTCYVGTARLAEEVKPGVRKIEIDLQELEGRGLMRRYTDRIAIPQENGTFLYRAVLVKDFTALYDFAYGYHLWLNSPDYVPAEREHENFFIKHPQLCEELIKYDNYRKIFTCQKPGRKPQAKPVPVAYQCQLSTENQPLVIQPQVAGEARTADLKPNNYIQEQLNNSSPYRETKKEESLPLKVSVSSIDLEGRVLEPVAIGNVQQIEQEETIQNSNNTAENKNEVIQTNVSPSKSNQSKNPQEEEIPAGTAKEEKEYTIEDLQKNPVAMTAFLLDLHAQTTANQKPTSTKAKPDTRKRRGTPEQLAGYMTYIVQQLGDNPKSHQSDVTRITKIYWAATQIFSPFANAWFLEQLREAFVVTMKARKVKKRVPYFFRVLENNLQLTFEEKAFIRSDEPLYKDGDIKDFIAQIRRTHEKSNSDLSYEDWIQQNYLTAGAGAQK